MRIAVCDDEPAQAQLLARRAQQWARERKIAATVTQYHSAAALLFTEGGEAPDVLLLDIQMPGTSGMELARHIRQRDERVAIIFVTSYADYMAEGYDVAALHYLMKPVSQEKLGAVLDRAARAATPESQLLIECPEGAVRVAAGDILCVEAFAHSCRVTTTQGALDARQSMGELLRLLEGRGFAQPHRSYLVGLRHVRHVGRDALLLDGGLSVPMSRRRFDAVQRAFLAYYREET